MSIAEAIGIAVGEEAAKKAVGLAVQLLDLVNVEDARKLLTETAVERANLVADIAERTKFQGEKP
jgi:hypothetical protein